MANFPCPVLDLQLTGDHLCGKPSAIGQQTRPIDNWVVGCKDVRHLSLWRRHLVNAQEVIAVKLCDPCHKRYIHLPFYLLFYSASLIAIPSVICNVGASYSLLRAELTVGHILWSMTHVTHYSTDPWRVWPTTHYPWLCLVYLIAYNFYVSSTRCHVDRLI